QVSQQKVCPEHLRFARRCVTKTIQRSCYLCCPAASTPVTDTKETVTATSCCCGRMCTNTCCTARYAGVGTNHVTRNSGIAITEGCYSRFIRFNLADGCRYAGVFHQFLALQNAADQKTDNGHYDRQLDERKALLCVKSFHIFSLP